MSSGRAAERDEVSGVSSVENTIRSSSRSCGEREGVAARRMRRIRGMRRMREMVRTEGRRWIAMMTNPGRGILPAAERVIRSI